MAVELGGDHVRTELPTRHDPHHVKDLEREDDDGCRHSDDRAHDVGNHDPEEYLDLSGAVHPGSL